jgi:hypothetical protein
MHLTVPVELEDLVQKHLHAGSYPNLEELFRDALLAFDRPEFTAEQPNLDAKIDRALGQIERHQVYTPEQARARLDALKLSHLRDMD